MDLEKELGWLAMSFAHRFNANGILRLVRVLPVLTLLIGCLRVQTLSNDAFQRLAPFDGVVTKIQQRPLSDESVPTHMTFDFRVTIAKDDGTKLIIKRVSAICGIAADYPATMRCSRMMFGYEGLCIKENERYSFPSDLYRKCSDL